MLFLVTEAKTSCCTKIVSRNFVAGENCNLICHQTVNCIRDPVAWSPWSPNITRVTRVTSDHVTPARYTRAPRTHLLHTVDNFAQTHKHICNIQFSFRSLCSAGGSQDSPFDQRYSPHSLTHRAGRAPAPNVFITIGGYLYRIIITLRCMAEI